METVKIVVVGDGAVGKTCMLISYRSGSFPTQYVPQLFDDYQPGVMWLTGRVKESLWDTTGGGEYDRLRPLSYPHTDVFIICFSVIDNASLDSVKAKWIPEIRTSRPDTPFILVGTKSDLRGDRAFMDARPGTQFVDSTRAMALAEELGCSTLPSSEAVGTMTTRTCCLECSAKSQDGLKAVFDTAIEVALFVRHEKNQASKRRSRRRCAVM